MTDLQQPDTTEGDESRGTSRTAGYFFALAAGTMVGIVLLNSALLFSYESPGYESMNRMGMFLGVLFTFGFFSWVQRYSTRPAWDGGAVSTWAVRAFSVIISLAFVLRFWDRIFDALWPQ